jgi:hypothetical protein
MELVRIDTQRASESHFNFSEWTAKSLTCCTTETQ